MQPVQAQPIQQPATTPVATAAFQPVAQVPMNQAVPGGQSPRTSQILSNWNAGQAAIAADSEQRRQAFAAQQAAQQAEAVASAPWEIAHGVAPHQVKGRSPQDVQIMQQEARNVDDWYNRLPNQPPPVSDVGFGQRPALGMRPEDAARIAEERALQQQNSNWDNSRHITDPNIERGRVDVSPGVGQGAKSVEGFRAAQRREVEKDPVRQAYMDSVREYHAKRDRGENAVWPGAMPAINKPEPPPDMITYVNGMPQKYAEWKQSLPALRKEVLARNAKEKAERKDAVVTKAKAKAAGMNVPNFERLQAVADSMRQQQQMTAQAWENIQSGQGTAGDYIVVGGPEAGGMAPENRAIALAQAYAMGNQNNPNGADPAIWKSIIDSLGIGGGKGTGSVGGEPLPKTKGEYANAQIMGGQNPADVAAKAEGIYGGKPVEPDELTKFSQLLHDNKYDQDAISKALNYFSKKTNIWSKRHLYAVNPSRISVDLMNEGVPEDVAKRIASDFINSGEKSSPAFGGVPYRYM